MHNRIFIEEDKEFTLDEFAHLVARAVRSVASVDIDKDEVVYSRDDVFFTIIDVLGYINERTPGQFKFDQTDFQSYILHYVPAYIGKRRKSKGLITSKAHSAIQIRDVSGNLPVWAEQNEDVMAAINEIENKPKAAPTDAVPHHVLENRAEIAVQIYERDGKLPDWVASNPQLKEMVEERINPEQFEMARQLLDTPEGDDE